MTKKKARSGDLPILPSTKVGALLERYPELEEMLIRMAPPFQKLRNPLLRKSVAKVASLKQAATVAGMGVADLVNQLRAAVGQEAMTPGNEGESESYFSERPAWFTTSHVVTSIEEKEVDPDKMPVVAVLQKAASLRPGEMLELITPFVPAPGIEVMKRKGLRVWSVREGPELIRTYVCKACD